LAALAGRLAVVVQLLGGPAVDGSADDALAVFVAAVERTVPGDGRVAWLSCVAATGRYPDDLELTAAARAHRLRGAAGLRDHVRARFVERLAAGDSMPSLEVVADVALVDLSHTTTHDLHTGIQRVARECAARWLAREDAVLVQWDETSGALQRLDAAEHERARAWRAAMPADGERPGRRAPATATGATIIPWHSVHVFPEVIQTPDRAQAMAVLQRSGVLAGQSFIVFDLIPIVAAEHTAPGVPEAFARYLAVVMGASAVAAISGSVAADVEAVFGALAHHGRVAPRVVVTPLPSEPVAVSEQDLASTRRRYALSGAPLVLVVGTHEPRKNHLAVLEAAEGCWRSGQQFQLVFVGGASWDRSDFADEVARLARQGDAVNVLRRVSEEALWSLYRLADLTIFVSLVEGYGLPVAESLCCGTPVVTSAVGSMAELAAGGGAVTVDPTDVAAIEEAVGALLASPERLAGLSREAAARTWPTWDDYAATLWRDLVDDVRQRAAPGEVAGG
jgi:glycosyltransferase involved in cell wall biosynthesis